MPTHVPIRPTWLFCFRVCVLCGGGRLENDVPKTPTLLQKNVFRHISLNTQSTDLKMSLAVHGYIQNQLLIFIW